MNNFTFSLPFLAITAAFLLSGCSIGARVQLTATDVQYPVSQTSSFYSPSGHLSLTEDYEIVEDFSQTFTKWGVSSIIKIHSHEDISNRLNSVIKKHDGDAIVDLRISIFNPPARNGLLLFTKTVALTAALITIPITIAEPDKETAIIAGSSSLIYLFTPASVKIKIEGKVVRLND